MVPQKVFCVMGPPYAGKDTLADWLEQWTGFERFVTSNILWKFFKQYPNAKITQEQLPIFIKGGLCASEWVLKMVAVGSWIFLKDGKSIIYSASPRTLPEANGLYPLWVEKVGKENVHVIILSAPDEVLRLRAKNRLTCTLNRGHTYSDISHKAGDACPKLDGGILVKNDLDNLEKFEKRMDEFYTKTLPAIQFLRHFHDVVEIDAEPEADLVKLEVMKRFNLG